MLCAPIVAAAQPAGEAGASDDAAKASEPAVAEPPVVPVEKPAPDKSASAAADAAPRFAWEPYGYLRMQYVIVQNDPNVQFVGRDDGFELQNARVGMRGTMSDVAAFTVAFEGGVEDRVQNAPQGKLRVGLRDAYADIWLGSGLAVHGGYFQTWVDPQAPIPDTVREFVDKPIESRGMRSTEGWYTPGLPPGRSLGAALRLDPKENQLGFEIAIQNGADEYAFNNDNDKPAVSASALFRLANHGFLVASGRWNPRTVGELPFRQDETDLQGSVGAQVTAGAITAGAGGIVQRTTFESTGGPVQNAFGAHAQVLFNIAGSHPVSLGYRFGILDPSSLITTDRMIEHTAGGMMAVPALRMRLQLQLTHVQEQAARELSNDRIQLAAEVAL